MQSSTDLLPSTAPFSPWAMRSNLAGFAFNGVLMSIYGPMLPAVAGQFHVGLALAGALLGLHFLGALVGAVAFWRLLGRQPPHHLLKLAYSCLALGFLCIIVASALAWFPLLCLGAIFGGLGFGGLDCGLSQIFAMGYHQRKTEMLNLLHGFFGLGTMLGPLALGIIGPSRYPIIFAIGLVISAIGFLFGRRCTLAMLSSPGVKRDDHQAVGFSIVSVTSVLFIILYLLHVAAQGSVGEWEPTQVRALSYPASSASLWTAAYWGGVALSRLAIAHGYVRAAPRTIVVVCCAGACVTAAATMISELLPVAYILFGFFIGPIFPVGLSWLTQVMRHPSDSVAVVVITSLIGGVIFPPLIGFAIVGFGLAVVPIAIFAISFLTLTTAFVLFRRHIDNY